jgi:uncharacterized membrane protein YhaH (DUF805 family)
MTNFLSFTGIATRSEYWTVHLTALVIFVAAILLSLPLYLDGNFGMPVLILLVSAIGYTWATMAVVVRRLRDADLNVWLSLICLVPYAGIAMFIFAGVFHKAVHADTV